ncbi:MAG: hypothetical protein WC631_01205 [Candidatus Paceibacterota bacterium]|jgi:hypothetical protein
MNNNELIEEINSKKQAIKDGLLTFDELMGLTNKILNFVSRNTYKSENWILKLRKFDKKYNHVSVHVDQHDFATSYRTSTGVSAWDYFEPFLVLFEDYLKENTLEGTIKGVFVRDFSPKRMTDLIKITPLALKKNVLKTSFSGHHIKVTGKIISGDSVMSDYVSFYIKDHDNVNIALNFDLPAIPEVSLLIIGDTITTEGEIRNVTDSLVCLDHCVLLSTNKEVKVREKEDNKAVADKISKVNVDKNNKFIFHFSRDKGIFMMIVIPIILFLLYLIFGIKPDSISLGPVNYKISSLEINKDISTDNQNIENRIYPNSTSTKQSAFDLVGKLRQFSTSLEKSNFINSISGTEVYDTGYIFDIKEPYETNSGYRVFISKDIESKVFLLCTFNPQFNELIIIKGAKARINFSGIIEEGFDFVNLSNCNLL